MIAHSDAYYPHRSIALRDNSARSPGTKISDAALIAAIARGDQQAMRRLYERMSIGLPAVWESITPLPKTWSARCFSKSGAAQALSRGRAQASTWLLAITRNRALDTMRRRPLEPLDEIASASIEDETDGPEAATRKKQAASILLEGLQDLLPAHREIIDLVYYHEKSIDEVARILDIPRGTVKTRMFYARKRLALLLSRSHCRSRRRHKKSEKKIAIKKG